MTIPAWHRTKIVCTLGPATDAPGVLDGVISAGMDIARINMSHGDHSDHARRIADVRHAAERHAQPVAILADLPGPKFRLGSLDGGIRTLEEGTLVGIAAASDPTSLPVRNAELPALLEIGNTIYLADGSIELRVVEKRDDQPICRVLIGGTVRSGSGINLPDATIGGVVPTADDRRHLAFALAQRVEWIGVSFVQSADDLSRVRACFPAEAQALLIAKIEKRQALAQLDAIVEAADGVMVARGDLGVETNIAEIPLVQKRIIARANACGRPVITATQMLESMIEHEHPTRAEVTDVANALLDGSDAVMLSGETAVGRHPVPAVEILNRVLAATESQYAETLAAEGLSTKVESGEHSLAFAACQLAARIGAAAIILIGCGFAAAAALARFRPAAPILALDDLQTWHQNLVLLRGVVPLKDPHRTAGGIDAARQWLFARGLAKPGAEVVLLFKSAPGTPEADTLRLAHA